MRSNTSRALKRWTTRWARGWTSSTMSPDSTASMNRSVTATERLKFARLEPSSLASTNSRMSGWSTRSAPMFAPRRRPPCLMFSVAQSKIRMNDTGPDASPPVEPTTSPRGRSREKEKPVPAAAPLHERHGAQSAEDPLHGVLHGEDEARGELAQRGPGVHQRRRVREEVQGAEEALEGLLPAVGLAGGPQEELRLGDGARHALEQLRGRLDHPAVGAAAQVAGLQDPQRVGRQLTHPRGLPHGLIPAAAPSKSSGLQLR